METDHGCGGPPLYVAVEDDKITFNTYPSVHRDYCGCVWGNVRMNCDSEQLRALAPVAGKRPGAMWTAPRANTYCFAVAAGAVAAAPGCSARPRQPALQCEGTMEVLKAILAALVGLLVIFACIAWAIAAVLGPLAIIKLCVLCLLG